MTELNKLIGYVAFFGIGLCVLALMVLCIVWVSAFIWHQIKSFKFNAKQRTGRAIRPCRTVRRRIRGAGTLRPGHRGFMHRVDGAIHHVRHMVTDELGAVGEDEL